VKLPKSTAVLVRAEEIAMKRLGVYGAGILLGLIGAPASAEAGVLGTTSRGTVSISLTIGPHVVVSEAPRPTGIAVNEEPEALCIATSGLPTYRATLLAGVNGHSEAIDLPLLRKSEVAADQQSCWQEVGAGTTVHVNGRALQTIRGSAEPATLLIVPD
jgi:hypothetical protein